MNNIFNLIPDDLEKEDFKELLGTENIRIERIISKGHTSPENGWYDQKENEWVIVLKGSGTILYEDGSEINLKTGDYINIPSHVRHKVSWTDPDNPTIWLAVFYNYDARNR